jgi:4-amino-4-deoxy-L-arabinose transferase-like glycosyltransferase
MATHVHGTPRYKITLVTMMAIVLLATAVRVSYLAVEGPYGAASSSRMADLDSEHAYAQNILAFGVYGVGERPVALVPAGMAVALAGVYKVFGMSFVVDAAFLIVLNVAICCLIWDMARRMFGMMAGIIAGVIASVYPPLVFRTTHVDSKILMVLGLCLGAWCLVREWETGKVRWLWLAGVAFGFGYLGRTQLLLLPAFLPLWAYLRHGADWARVRTTTAVILVGMVPLMMIWVVRNYIQFDAFIPGISQQALAFASINNGAAYARGRLRGTNMLDTAASLFTPDTGLVDAAGNFTRQFYEMDPLERDRMLEARTWKWIRDNPGKMAIMVLFKWKALWLSPQTYQWPFWMRIFNIALYLGVILPFCVVGLRYLLKVNPRPAGAIGFWFVVALYTTVLQSVFEGEIRHRVAFEPGMIMLAAAGLASMMGRATAASEPTAAVAAPMQHVT